MPLFGGILRLAGLRLAVSPAAVGVIKVERETVPLKPFRLPTLTVDEEDCPARKITAGGFAKAKSTTEKTTLVEFVTAGLAELPLTVTV